ncbi:MAG: corrinoid protein [Deltaproteobacteria bacterium]|nr:MAG: corrinoid protein [Deltaproteobacteria bacterium]
MEELKRLVITGDAEKVAQRVQELMTQGVAVEDILKRGLITAMDEVGDMFQKGEYFVPEMLIAARAMNRGLAIIKPAIVEKGIEPVGKMVIGTVKGDLHDIGKNLVAMALEGAGFEVIDLGSDVSPERFVEAVKEHNAELLGMSALLTTTMLAMKDTVKAVEDAGIRDKVKIMIGGAPVQQEFADEIGADLYARDSTAARNLAREVISGEV